jgi:hypothetical protein
VSCQLLCVLELAWIGHWSAVTALLTVAACSSWMFVRDARALAGAPNRLLLTADGRLFALTPGGQVLPQRLHPSTRHLGRWLYLRLHDKAGMHAWLLGPDNLDPATLASLRRRIGSMANRDFD